MNSYEMVLIVDGGTSEEDAKKIANRIGTTITNNQGKIEHLNYWGRRKLAYPIRKKQFGYYFVIYFKDNGKSPAVLQRLISIDEFAIKCLIRRCEDIKIEQELFLKLQTNPRVNADLYQNFRQND